MPSIELRSLENPLLVRCGDSDKVLELNHDQLGLVDYLVNRSLSLL